MEADIEELNQLQEAQGEVGDSEGGLGFGASHVFPSPCLPGLYICLCTCLPCPVPCPAHLCAYIYMYI